MGLLLDTHALLWWWTDDANLPASARRMILDESNEILVSAASAWEIATKARLGKLTGVPGVLDRFSQLITADGFSPLPVTHVHALRAGSYDQTHRDPFDRMLAAQSELEAVPLLTRDPAFRQFSIETAW
ncbi:MAG: type II toxin-antitoxin system VapC family toxin [Gammaproteobacteria bacterium]|nr:type II toxin-antitoxin system VapC family toxin [Gammaproteobacteria bacterium]